MKIQTVVQKLALFAGTVSLSVLAFACPLATMPAQAAEASAQMSIQPRKDDIQYRYKIENGKVYKCLYNYSTCNWIGEWVYVCEYPG